jgi:hypothetical protein
MENININPVNLGLSLGTVTSVKISMNYTLGSNTLIVKVRYFDQFGLEIGVLPVEIPVPEEVLQSWNIDLSPLKSWTLQQLGLTEITS